MGRGHWIVYLFLTAPYIHEMLAPAFGLQPKIEGYFLNIHPLKECDFESLYKVASDPLIWDQHPLPRFERDAFSEFFKAAEESNSGVVVLDRATGKIVGASRYYDLRESQISVGYTFLARSHWGGIYNRELKTLMLSHAFKYVSMVHFDIGETNKRSRKAIEKIGARLIKLQTIQDKPYTLYAIDERMFQASLQLEGEKNNGGEPS